MAIVNYMKDNKRKTSIVSAILLVAIVLISVMVYKNQKTNAGVFVKNENGEYEATNTVNILEIVAQYGQQVLGYTVKGYEPITKEQIEEYHGNIEDLEDFKNATGYVISKNKPDSSEEYYNYKVESSELEDTFNLNVLEDSMSNEDDKIVVTVCQANELTEDVINSADLVYINSNDYNDNLLFYYDQIVNNGEGNVMMGDKGANYNSSYEIQELKQKLALEKIQESTGKYVKANKLVIDDFINAGVINAVEYNCKAYIDEIAKLESKSLNGISDDESLNLINELIDNVNSAETENGISIVNRYAGVTSLSEEDKQAIVEGLKKCQLINYFECNNEQYFEMISKSALGLGTISALQNVITNVNTRESEDSINSLIELKKNVEMDDIETVSTFLEKLAYAGYNKMLAEGYTSMFNSSFDFSNMSKPNVCYTELKTLIDTVNNEKKSYALEVIAKAPIDEEMMTALKENKELYFEIAGLEGYNKYNVDNYIQGLENLDDKKSLLSAEDGETEIVYNVAKINEFIELVNNNSLKVNVTKSNDISWENALLLYDYAVINERGLMYNTEILTKLELGNYNIVSDNNTNNLYKVLLLMRQITEKYYSDNLVSRIDINGVYFAEGIDENGVGIGNGINSWDKTTFGNDYTNYAKYREPEVVGTTYNESGIIGNNVNYIYKHIYSYSGKEFVGGSDFLATPDASEVNYLSKKTAGNGKVLVKDELQSDYVNNIATTGTKGEIIRYIMGISINELASYPMRVLEIEPAADISIFNSYEGAKKLADYLRIDTSGITEDNWNKEYFIISSMSVKEFNTRNDDLQGQYDLIYMGTDSGHLLLKEYGSGPSAVRRTDFNDTKLNGYVYTGIGDIYTISNFMGGTAASDYSAAKKNLKYDSKVAQDMSYWKTYFFDQFTGNVNESWNLDKNTNYFRNSNPVTTRLTGNDLTVKRMNELIDYVKAGYPILMDDELINCDDTNKYIPYDGKVENSSKWTYVDPGSKIYEFISQIKSLGYNSVLSEYDGKDSDGNNVFGDSKKYANLVNIKYAKNGLNPDKLSASDKFNGGLQFAIKRCEKVVFSLESSPQLYSKKTDNKTDIPAGNLGTVIKKGTAGYSSYQFVLNYKTYNSFEWLDENYAYEIYIDKSGTGRFDDEYTISLEPEYEYVDGTNQIVLEGNWPGNMDGFMPWKVVAYEKDNPEKYFEQIGFSAFETQTKKDVYILWVKTNYLTLNFNDVITADVKAKIQDYNLHLYEVSYNDFVNKWKNEPEFNADGSSYEYDENKSLIRLSTFDSNIDRDSETDEEFNMIVFGFCDSYSGLDISNIQALKNIDYFVESGHSLLFAHDNASYYSTMNYYTSSSGSYTWSNSSVWGRYTTSYMRKMLGMDTYGAVYSGTTYIKGSANYNEDGVANARLYLNTENRTLTQADFRGYVEQNVFKHATDHVTGYTNDVHSTSGAWISDWQHTYHVTKINEGQISQYPFIIGDDIATSQTHSQYMTLNMEDDDISVWYTLAYAGGSQGNGDSKYYQYTEGDGANNYFIYSKGNITYTGSGHAKGQTTAEKNLWVNTVIAAIKAGKFKPDVTFPGESQNSNGEYVAYLYDTDDGLSISFKATDYDNKKDVNSFTDCKLYIDVDTDGSYTEGTDILLNVPGDINATSTYLKDSTGTNYINFAGPELFNRKTYSFFISNEDIENLVANSNGVILSIYDKPIVVQVTDNGSAKDPTHKNTVSNSINVVSSKLFNLN